MCGFNSFESFTNASISTPTHVAHTQAPQAAWAAARRPPSDKGGAMLPQKPQPSKKQLLLQQQLQQQQPLPGFPGLHQGKAVGAAANPARKVRGGGNEFESVEIYICVGLYIH